MYPVIAMPAGDVWMWALRAFTIIAGVLLVFRLYYLGLYRVYRGFFAYLIFQTGRSLILLPLDPRSGLYGSLYANTIPVLWVFYILVVIELYSLVLQNYRGIYTLGRWTLYVALAISLLISIVTLIPTWKNAPEPYRILYISIVVDRGVSIGLVLFLFFIMVFLSRYPVPLSRNLIVHAIVYTVFFLSGSMAMLIRIVLGHHSTRALNIVLQLIGAACYVGWLFGLSREGEKKIVVLRHDWKPADERRLIDQLDSLNATLLRARGK